MIDGEIAYRKGEFDAGVRLTCAKRCRRDDALNYDEPWGWMQPARHAAGGAAAGARLLAESEAVYREDLDDIRRIPGRCTDWPSRWPSKAKPTKPPLRLQCEAACERADVTINRSCYCRLNVAEAE